MRIEHRDVYVANDGTPFFDEKKCQEYEVGRERDQARNDLYRILEAHACYDQIDLDDNDMFDALLDWRDACQLSD